jgi:acetyltransferase
LALMRAAEHDGVESAMSVFPRSGVPLPDRMAAPTLRPGLQPLLFPRSAALIGVSERTGEGVVENVLGKGIPIWGVHPRLARVRGLDCFPSVEDLPAVPEVALMLVGHRRIEQAFEDALRAGVRAFILPGLGNEAGAEGATVAARIASRALEANAAIVGPNCMGVAVPQAASFWIGTVPETFIPGHVATVVQSGSIGEALLALGRRVGFRCVVSSGGEHVRDAADFCAFFAQDEGTRAVGLFLEAVHRPWAFAHGLEALARAGKPVVCLKVGRSPAGAAAVLAHSGALVGSDRAFSALLRGYGVIEVEDYPEFVEVLEVLGRRRRPRGVRIGGVSNSGGEGALLADHAQAAGIPFEPLPPGLAQALRDAFPNYMAPQNPVDAWAIDEVERIFPGTLQLLAGSGAFDILVAQVDQSQFLGAPEAANALLITRALADAVVGTGIFPAVTSVQTGDPTVEVATLAHERDVALLRGSRPGMRALAAVGHWSPCFPTPDPAEPVDLRDLLRPGPLPEEESALVLERYGVRVARRRRAGTADEAAAAATELGFPVVVKLDGPAHKSRLGGVILGLHDAAAVHQAASRLAAPVLVASQVRPGAEAFCGMSRDPDYGPVLAVGLGGHMVEAVPSIIQCSIAPIDMVSARRLVASAPGVAALTSNAARDSLARVLVALGRLAVDHPEIVSVDVNPLILAEEGAVAVDALVVVQGPAA